MDPQLLELIEGGDGGEEVEVILKLRPDDAVPPYVRVVTRFGDIATSRVRRDRVAAAWEHPAVLSAKAPRLVAAEVEPPEPPAALDEALGAPVHELRMHGTGAAGRGVVLGVVDWGLDIAHPNFRHADGSTRVLALWNQDARQTGEVPAPYGYGAVHTSADINRALRGPSPYAALGYHPADSDSFGDGAHGTHVCDIAAGNGRAPGSIAGMAPEAELVFVQLAARGTGGLATLGDTVRILEALDFIRTAAGERPWVANLSVGRCGGPHTGLTLVEQGIDALLSERPGCAVGQSAGNYFASLGHAAGQLRPGETRTLTWITDRADVTPNELEIWYPGRDAIVVEIAFPSGEVAARVVLGERAAMHVAGRECGRAYHRRHDPSNGDHHVDIFLDPATAPAGAWRVTLIGEDVVDGRFDAWVERDSGCATCQSRFDARDAESLRTTGTIANGFRSIAVGAYDPHDPQLALAPFSSCGPTRDGRQKPDLVAPGVRIVAARSAPRAGPWTPVTVKSGTSMAAPHVTGTIACMFEAAQRPLWIHETRRLLLGSARGVNASPPLAARFGSGYLDPAGAITAARSSLGAVRPTPIRIDASAREVAMPTYEMSDADGPFGEEPAVVMEGEEDAAEATLTAGESESSDGGEWWEDVDDTLLEEDAAAEVGASGEGARLVAFAEKAFHGGGVAVPAAALVEATLAESGSSLGEALGSPGGGEYALTILFDALTGRASPSLRRRIEQRFEVIAVPRGRPVTPLAAGDIFLRRPAGEPRLAHAGLLVSGELIGRDVLALRHWDAERSARGVYALVIEGGAFPHCAHRPFARRMLDERGLVPPGQIVLRLRRAAPVRLDVADGAGLLAEQGTTVGVRVHNRILRHEPVASCELELFGTAVRATTSASGTARLDLAGVPDGRYWLRVLPASRTTDPVGPAIASATPRPSRIWRPLDVEVTVAGGRITAAGSSQVTLSGSTLTVQVQPVWIASPNRSARRSSADTAVTHCVIHHTSGTRLSSALYHWLGPNSASTHYVIDVDGQIVKLVHEDDQAWHAGRCHWGGRDDLNEFTIGIEIVNATEPYPDVQYDALIDLLDRIRAEHPGIAAWNIVGHSDIGTCPSPDCPDVSPRRLGRKWTDPGVHFEWSRLENRGLGMIPASTPLDPAAYGGFFATVAGGRLRSGDRDAGGGAANRYGGARRPAITTEVIRELQRDLGTIGYYCPVTGSYDTPTQFAVRMLHEHFFSGTRPRAAHHGEVDERTATTIKGLLMVPVAAPVAGAPAAVPVGGGTARGLAEVARPITLRARNRVYPADSVKIANATVELFGYMRFVGAITVARATTNAAGDASLDLTGVDDGSYTLRVLPTHTNTDPVGPAIGDPTSSPPSRIWRPFLADVTVTGERISASTSPDVTIAGHAVTVSVQPAWMQSRSAARPAGAGVTLCVVHHTGGTSISRALDEWIPATARKSVHYVIGKDGQVVKMVHESRRADHAGNSHWAGRDSVNNFSVGIEIVNADSEDAPDPYTNAQMIAVTDLLTRITAAHSATLPARNIVGHADVATCPQPGSGCDYTIDAAHPRRLARKSSDPGVNFDWARLEAAGLGMIPPSTMGLSAADYGGFFSTVAGGRLRTGDRDAAAGAANRYGGAPRPAITTAVIRELQRDLRTVGYFCPDTGSYDSPTLWAVAMFQEHFFSGRRPRAAHSGSVDQVTAEWIKAFVAPPAAAAAPAAPAGVPAPGPAPAPVGAAPGDTEAYSYGVPSHFFEQPAPPPPPPPYGGYDLRRGDRDDRRLWGGAVRSAAAGHVVPAPGTTPFVEQLQQDLRTLGFALVGRADGDFGRVTEWAVREFQIYAKMQFVAREAPPPAAPATAPARYVDRLAQVANTQRYTGPVSGVVNADTRTALQHWLTNRWRCPVVVEAWNVDASGTRTRLRNENIWLHDEVQVPARRMFVRDFSGYYPLPATRNANDLIVVGQFAAFGALGGPATERPRSVWPEAEMTPENLIGTALARLTPAQRSTYKIIRAVSEVENNAYFDVINAYDDVFVSLGPYHWPIGHVADTLGDLGAYLSFLRHADPAAFEQAVGFFGVRPTRAWARPGVPDGRDLFATGSRRHMGWLALEAEGGRFTDLPGRAEEANYFRTWHWFYRFVMAGRTIDGFRRSMWQHARRRVLDILETPWGPGVTNVPLPPPPPGATRPATIGDVYTSERAIALLTRWHVRCPAHVVNGGRAGQHLRDAFARARIPASAGNPTRWTDAHEQALIDGIMDEVRSITAPECGARGLAATMTTVHDWPTWATGAHPANPWNYTLDPAVGRLSVTRRSAQFDTTGLPVTVAPAAPAPAAPAPAAPAAPAAPVPAGGGPGGGAGGGAGAGAGAGGAGAGTGSGVGSGSGAGAEAVELST